MRSMQIRDGQGRLLTEAVLQLSHQEISELLVAASEVDDGAVEHAMVRDSSGQTLAMYLDTGEPAPLSRHVDWLIGPAILLAVILMVVGAYTVARGFIRLIF